MATSGHTVPLPPDQNDGPTILGVTIAMTLLGSVVSLVPRLYVRVKMMRNVGWDDYTMVIASALSLVAMVLVVFEVKNGAGRHRQYIDPDTFSRGLYYNFLSQPFYLFNILFVKLSVGFFLLRLADRGRSRWIIVTMMIVLTIYTIACFFTILLQCKDLRALWDPTVVPVCWSMGTLQALGYTNSVISILTDFAFAVLIPIPLLWKLQMNKRKKTSLVAILGMGIFASAGGVVRAVYISNYGKQGDFLWDSRNITIWYAIESQIGIIAANLPCSKPLFRRLLGDISGSWSRSRSTGERGTKYGTQSRTLKGSHFGSKIGHVEEIEIGTFGAPKRDTESDMVAIVHVGEPVSGDNASRMSDESVTALEREIGGGGMSVKNSGGIMRTTNVRIDYEMKQEL